MYMKEISVSQFPRISTVFDRDEDSPHSILYNSSIRNSLMKLLPPNFLLFDEALCSFATEFSFLLPIVKSQEWGESKLSVYLLCRHQINGVKFFYEMIGRWLLPGKRLAISSFFATDFQFPEFSNELFTICEIVLSLGGPSDLATARHQLPIIESEIRMGLVSVYHAKRILEIKGLSADEKTSLIQERIVSLLERRPRDFDHDLFTQMQHFLVVCSQEFKNIRDYAHMSRIIYVFYLFKKMLKAQIEKTPSQQFVYIKVSQTFLQLPFGVKKVVGVFAALNFQGDNELFEERHFVAILKTQFLHLSHVEESFFSRSSKEDRIQLLYLEVEKEDGSDWSLSEIKSLKQRLPDEIRNGIEKLTQPLFMPRNEEEVMRNMITLSNQLSFSKDLPQVMINFDEQSSTQLAFTVIWLRVLKPWDLAIQKIFDGIGSFLKFVPDRVKALGLLRKKHVREATVFRLKCPASMFLRADHCVDLFKARQAIVVELQRIFGEFRDYNGGMIAKQHEQFIALREMFSNTDKNQERLLEHFFHSIYPIELRSLFNPIYLKNLFDIFQDAVQKNKGELLQPSVVQKTDATCCYLLVTYIDPDLKERMIESIREMQDSSSQLLTISLDHLGLSYLGFIYMGEEVDLSARLCEVCSS